MTEWNESRHVSRVYSSIVIAVQSILIIYLVAYIYRHRRQSMTTFTILMLSSIALSLVIGISEAITFLLATDPDTSKNLFAIHFISYGCSYYLSLLSEV